MAGMLPEFTINPWGLTGTMAVLLAWSLAVFLLRSAERDRLTVLFAIVLIVEGVVLVTSSSGLVQLIGVQPPRSYWWAHHTADCLMLIVYPLFLARALPQRVLRVLRRPIAVPILVLVATAALSVRFFSEFWLIALLLALMFTIAFGLALHAIFVARTTLARRRAILFAIAFGIRDIAWSIVYASAFLGVLRGTYAADTLRSQIYAGSTLLYVPIVTYGILSMRLLNIRVRLRQGVQHGTLAAVFVAIFFLISEGAASFLSEQFGSVLGLLGAALIVFLVAPLHRLTEWLSGRVVPDKTGSDYHAYRKLQMYAAAVEDALAHGDVGPSQRALLDRLRQSLEVSNQDAVRIEADLGLSPARQGNRQPVSVPLR